MLEELQDGLAQGARIAGVLADAQTSRLLRALSLSGPTTVAGLSERMALTSTEVYDILARTAALGVTRRQDALDPRFEVDAGALCDVMRQYCDDLLRAAA